MAEMGEQLDMTVEWSEELGFGNFIEALNTNRIDAMCSGTWTNATRGSVVDFIIPISYQGVTAFVRADDTRFDYNLEAINNPDIKASAIDGGTSQEIIENFFPKMQLMMLPQMADSSQMLLNVSTGKADITFTDRHTVNKFLDANPGVLREVPAKYPIRLFGNPLAVKKGEYELKQTLDNATLQLIHTGVIERILKKHEKYPNTFYRPAPQFVNTN